jgi:hypothetical protein
VSLRAIRPEGKFVGYFFLVGFLVAFFFAIVLFNFGLDLAAFVPGFFFTGISYPPRRSMLLDKRKISGFYAYHLNPL